MSESYLWIKAAHVIGFVVWVGGLVGLSVLVSSHRRINDASVADLVDLERGIALLVDIGALVAVVCGVALILKGRNMGDAWVMKQGWMHVKLTGVLGIIGLHGYIRVQVGKAKRGDRSGMSPVVVGVLLALFVGVVIMGVARPIGG